MLVRKWMTLNPVTVTPDTPLAEAYRIFHEYEIRHLPVVEGEKLVGVLSDRDVGREAILGGGLEQTVATLMTREVVTTSGDAPVQDAALEMHNRKIGCLPVIDGDRKLLGILTRNDLLEILVSQLSGSR